MAKEREDRKKEKKEKKRREAEEELEVREKKISKKSKSKSKTREKPKKKSKKFDSDGEEKPLKKSSKDKKKKHKSSSEEEESKKSKDKKKKKKKHKSSSSSEEEESEDDDEPQTQIVDSNPDSDSELFDKEDIKQLVESYTKEELVNLIYKTAEKSSRLVSAVLESAERDSTKRNIFVRGLGDTTRENLKTAFEVYGEIEECSVVLDKDTGKTKGFGFVLFKTRKAAREALRHPEKRMYNRTVNIALVKPSGFVKPSREPVETVKIDLTHTAANQTDVDLAQQHQNMPMYTRQNMPFYAAPPGGLPPAPPGLPPGYNPMYAAMMLNQAAALMGNHMVAPVPNYPMFAPGMMNQGPPNHVGKVGQYVGEGNGGSPAFDDEAAW